MTIRFWHPLRDPHHCSFRVLSMLYVQKEKDFSIARASIIDLFLLFPHYLYDIRLDLPNSRLRSDLNFPKKKESFEYIPDVRLIYRELQIYQKVAFLRLVGRDIFDPVHYRDNKTILVKWNNVPIKLLEQIEIRIARESRKYDFFADIISEIPLEGRDGLIRMLGISVGGRLS